jgi:hypothetical protein
MFHEGVWVPNCAVCRESVTLEESKTDEYGQAVLENGYVWTVELNKPRRPVVRMDAVREWPAMSVEAS